MFLPFISTLSHDLLRAYSEWSEYRGVTYLIASRNQSQQSRSHPANPVSSQIRSPHTITYQVFPVHNLLHDRSDLATIPFRPGHGEPPFFPALSPYVLRIEYLMGSMDLRCPADSTHLAKSSPKNQVSPFGRLHALY